MTTAYTPGPWHWDCDPVKNDPTGRVRYQVTALGKTIAKTYYSSFEGGLTNAEADTKLIAAAPDLLAALEGCRDMILCECADGGYTPQVAAANAAIAKATGAE